MIPKPMVRLAQTVHLSFDEILTYSYVKPRVQWFPNEEDPYNTPGVWLPQIVFFIS
jgi:hypothetical protein